MMIIIVFLITLLIGAPIMCALGLSTIIPAQINMVLQSTYIAQTIFTGLYQFVLIAVSGFIFAGILMEKSGITNGLLDIARETVGRLPGGYAMMCIFASTFFAALTGAGPACTAAIGALTIPLMQKAGYNGRFTAAVAASGGSLGVMIPPSNPMVVYSVIAGTSVGEMFIAGIIPGIFTAILMCLVCYITAKRNGFYGVSEPFTWKRFFKALWSAKWGLLAPILILGGIYGGFVTPTEASIVACFYALIIGFVKKTLTLKDVVDALKRTAVMSGSILAMVGVCTAFARSLTINQIPQAVATAMMTLTRNPYLIQILIMLLLIFMGMWLEGLATLIVMVPIFLPIVNTLGINKVAFGIMLVVTQQIAMITPPFAVNLFVVSKMTGESLMETGKGVLPFIGVLAIVALTIVFVPGLATWLPSLM